MCEFAMNDEMIMISVVDLLNSCIHALNYLAIPC
jgi:hypothetical protein